MHNLRSTTNNNSSLVSGGVGEPLKHESSVRHVSGSAPYVDDINVSSSCLHAYPGGSTASSGRIKSLDLKAVRKAPGVIDVFTADDVPGDIDIGPVFPGDLLLASEEVSYFMQPLFLVLAESQHQARQAALLADCGIEEQQPLLDVQEALSKEDFVRPPHMMRRGNVSAALLASKHQLEGEMHIGGQEHFYLEGQVSLSIPTEEGGVLVYTSSQHPSEIQKLVAKVLAVPINHITVEVRRMGGAFGGKETQAAQWACLSALAAKISGRPVKVRLSRSDDFALTGKRHPFFNRYSVGFDETGLIQAADIEVTGNCGISPDLSDGIVDRAMFHADNAYYYPEARITGNRCRTNMVSHTAFRGFGGPQGMLIAERMVDDIARKLGKDPLDIRKLNLYRTGRDKTVYDQDVNGDLLLSLIESLESDSDYRSRREAIKDFNSNQPILRKGLALTPVKFGISFTANHLNQAGALIHIYTDGTVHLNHGGTEMGQGLFTKVAQVVAQVFSIDVNNIICSAARTDKIPNTSPTAASAGSDLNGMAAFKAATKLKKRIIKFLARHYLVPPSSIEFSNNQITFEGGSVSFAAMAKLANFERISLSEKGFYRTPEIHYDRESATGKPFYYYTCGAAVSEVLIDSLTGEYRISRVDIRQDIGNSINPAVDIGQIEGGFVQGLGWLTTEELIWDDTGRLITSGPATYKIPSIGDIPEEFNVSLHETPNSEKTVFHSKGVGEPPLPLAISVWCALRDACSSFSNYTYAPSLNPPATPERVLASIAEARENAS